ncbi:SDR family NAD(P)-dependent oxidoreductase [Roseomonas sp. GC11]|uniref:SDR family NAD(P)-dependent oxidoreductase n=1 Tax=Roseomonas sp. GC11 TaxID=2950546 RepID=UPI002108CF0A|nr:SDR family NAD(P)-dependent oxidoreductase [Roseomonas sp. GC11]MCQ4160795.1 SDR family NAD(P)-dependent oxidoreductase [Roseomonas sp. GC11]
MAHCTAILGAGPGLGTALARQYGREGHAVALVARRAGPLAALAARLTEEGITATAFPADLRDPEEVASVLAAIEALHGAIGTLYYGPSLPETFIPAFSLSVATVKEKMELFLYGLIAAVGAVLPGMRARGRGSILAGLGGSAAVGLPFMSGPGPALAAARNYLHALHGELAPEGIHVGMLTLSAVIRGSGWQEGMASGAIRIDLPPGFTIPEVDPEALATMLRQWAETRAAAELIYPPPPQRSTD